MEKWKDPAEKKKAERKAKKEDAVANNAAQKASATERHTNGRKVEGGWFAISATCLTARK